MFGCPEKTEGGPNLSLLADLEVLYKQEVKAKAELKTVKVLKTYLNKLTVSQPRKIYQFKIF